MTQKELDKLNELLTKLQEERMQELRDEGYEVDDMDCEELYELDDGDRLLEGIDIVYSTTVGLKGTEEDEANPKAFTHIRDCWNAIRECKTTSEIREIFEQFPNWAGDWDILIANGTITVVNNYYDASLESFEEDLEDVDVVCDDDEDDRSEMPWDYGKHFE